MDDAEDGLFGVNGVFPRGVSTGFLLLSFGSTGSLVKRRMSSVVMVFKSDGWPVLICGGERMLFHLLSVCC